MYNSWVEISKSAILHNLVQFQRLIGRNADVMPIIKSNAYGHGMIEVVKIISSSVNWFGVVSLGEALELRRHKIRNRILVLSYAQSRHLKEGIRQGIELPVYDPEYAKIISKAAVSIGKKVKVHVKIDTGCGRIGVMPDEAIKFIKEVKKYRNIEIRGIFSHFASAEDDEKYTAKQLAMFDRIVSELKKAGINIPYTHIACSAAILTGAEAHHNLVRLGIGLYGLWPSNNIRKIAGRKYPWLKLKPAMTWKTKIVQIKEVPAGSRIGYGGTYRARKKMRIAILAAGYWEGYDRKLSNPPTFRSAELRRVNNSCVQVKNKKCPVIGRICMNLMMADVSKVKDLKAGDEAVLIGKRITADDLAKQIGTINYEVVTRINPLLPRVIVK